MKKKSGEQDNANLVKALKGLLTKYTLAMDGGIVKTIDEKLGRLIKAEQDLLALREAMAAKDKEVEALKAKLADRQTLALQMNRLAIMVQNRVQELKERDTKNAVHLATLIVQRDTFMNGGTRAEDLKAVLRSTEGIGAPKGFDKPAQTIRMDVTGIRHIDENATALKEFDEFCEWMSSPEAEHSKGRGGLSLILAEMMGLRDVSSLFREHSTDCSKCPSVADCPFAHS